MSNPTDQPPLKNLDALLRQAEDDRDMELHRRLEVQAELEKEAAAHVETQRINAELREALKYKQRGMTFTESERNVELVRQVAETRERLDEAEGLRKALVTSLNEAGAFLERIIVEHRRELAETREQLRVLEDELHRLRDIAIPKFQIHRKRLEEQLAQAQTESDKLRLVLVVARKDIWSIHAFVERDQKDPALHVAVDAVRDIDMGLAFASLAALRAKPEPEAALRPAESEASDATSFQGGKPNE